MKIKLNAIFIIIILTSVSNFSQTHQIYGSYGYNFPTSTTMIGYFSNLESTKINTSTFAKGSVSQAGYSFWFNENIALELNVNYLFGVSKEKYTYELIDGTIYPGLSGQESSGSYSNSNLGFAPTVKLKTTLGNFSPYVKIGASINFITIKVELINPPPRSIYANITTIRDYTYDNDYSIGWVSGIGLSYLIQSGISVFSEFQINGITFYADEVEYLGQIYKLKEEIPDAFPGSLSWAIKDFPFSSMGVLIGLSVGL